MQGDDDARIEDLRPDDRVRVECGFGHIEHLTRSMLATAGVPAHYAHQRSQTPAEMQRMSLARAAELTIEWAEGHC